MDRDYWNKIVSEFDQHTLLQCWEWGKIKSLYGWKPDYYVKEALSGKVEAAALILSRELRLMKFGPVIKILYLPHGPLLDWKNKRIVQETFDYLKRYSKQHNAAYIKVDPQFIISQTGADNSISREPQNNDFIEILEKTGWIPSNQQIQFRNTFWIDLSFSEDDLLAGMKQKTRYNIRFIKYLRSTP